MNKTIVVHCKKEAYDVYIGRECYGFPQSKWGNPFKIGQDGTREEVIDKYREWILNQPDLLKDLRELSGKVLGCWCKKFPNIACHGDILAELADREWFKLNVGKPISRSDAIGLSNKILEDAEKKRQDYDNDIAGVTQMVE